MAAEEQAIVPLTNKDLERLVTWALEEARAERADQAEVGVSVDTGLSVTVRLGEVDTLEYQRDHGLLRPSQGLGEHRRPETRGDSRYGAQGLQHCALYCLGQLCRAG